eukprot:TRINITY_DN578_c0_g1_i1.p1 TRINITY_DN578_c0_g1~~TRINITY_DN578_c0_g1_i1.p1  ORF type:complete len:667 (-),score=231.33 TRINITY_DN578_c0_g1_i1:115-2115(-)
MCGIFAYLNYETPQNRKVVVSYLLQGLRRLEYRGYDSAGFSIDEPGTSKPGVYRKQGNINALEAHVNSLNLADEVVNNHIGIAHTRWATHGVPSDINSHPHRSDPNNEFVAVHNGIITNYKELKDKLVKKGYVFESETDTECIPKLCKYFFDKNPKVSFVKLLTRVANVLQGAFALIVKSSRYPGEVVAVKRGSPMILGIKLPQNADGSSSPSNSPVKVQSIQHSESLLAVPFSAEREFNQQAEYFIASDSTAIVDHTKLVIMLQDNDLLHFKNGQYWYYNTSEENLKDRLLETLDIEMGQIDMGGYKHFMLKEIFEQPETVVNTMRGRINFEKNKIKLGGIESFVPDIRNSRRIIFIACGTSYHSAVATRPLVEELTGIPVTLELASDFLDRQPRILRNDTCVFISQSGETADSLKALEYCRACHALCVGITNTVGSAIARATDCGIYLMCGPEIGVASTKAYTSQIIAITLMALKIGEDKVSTQARRDEIIQGLKELPKLVSKVLEREKTIKDIAAKIYEKKSLLVMGRGNHYGTCLEGALKIKEISYMHCEGVLSGELKHGPLALVDDSMPILFVMTKDKHYESTLSSFNQVTARKGVPIIICTEGDNRIPESYDRIEVPQIADCLQCILNIIPLQLMSYHVADMKGINVDRPRNLAKSVTTL